MANYNVRLDKNITVMISEPGANLTIEIAQKFYREINSEQELANLYSVVSNKAWWLADNDFDYEEGTEQYKESHRITEQWFVLEEKLKKDIFKILRKEGIKIPKRGHIVVLEPFMQRYGYQNGDGWWIQASDL